LPQQARQTTFCRHRVAAAVDDDDDESDAEARIMANTRRPLVRGRSDAVIVVVEVELLEEKGS